ncbi:MAG: hypothetical protein BWK73_43100 [Thiothrix lacustris]|uniref:Uncharacterized protein n=1 Tax=Thiothrix lacustris TaxID=525917 RepID=A0A1Y1QCC5_9GAMM|nr:MAG: hypothetical protein BWK73_43100 [Thiothrix lacustris]
MRHHFHAHEDERGDEDEDGDGEFSHGMLLADAVDLLLVLGISVVLLAANGDHFQMKIGLPCKNCDKNHLLLNN